MRSFDFEAACEDVNFNLHTKFLWNIFNIKDVRLYMFNDEHQKLGHMAII